MIFNGLSAVGDDPILLVSKMYRADTNPNKVDLGVGVYKDADGNTAILKTVKKAEEYLVKNQATKTYLSPAGNAEYNEAIKKLILGEDHIAIKEGRAVTFQAPGGTGGVRIGLDFLKTCKPDSTVWISDPTWPNHHAIAKACGLNTNTYRYYNRETATFLYSEMMDDLQQAKEGDLIIFHGCCHNASGADPSKEQWNEIADLCVGKGLVPLIDNAYQGFAEGIEEDAYSARLLAEKCPEAIIASSCSKNFALYRDRVGAVTVISSSPEQNEINGSHVLMNARSIYSMPPDHGAAVVAHILTDDALRNEWIAEVNEMRERVKSMRQLFVSQMNEKAPNSDFNYIAGQNGMFSFLTLSPEQIQTLIKDHSIFLMANGRTNIAGFTPKNLEYVTDSIASLF